MSAKKLYFFNFCYGVFNSVAIQMLPLILVYKGFDDGQVATLLSVVFLAALFQPLLGIASKKWLSDVSVMKLLVIAAGVSSLVMFFSTMFGMMLLLILLFSVARLSISPINDSYATNQVAKHGGNYGLIRSGASLGFGCGMIIYTIIADILGANYNFAFIFMLGVTVVALSILSTLPREEETETSSNEVVDEHTSNWPMYILLVMIYALYFGGLGVRITYLSTYYVEFGYTTLFISLTTFVMIIPEITVMPMYNRLFSRFNKYKLIAISILLGIIQIILYITCYNNPAMLVFTSLFNGFQIMIFFPSYFFLLQKSLGPKNSSFGFLLNMTSQSLFVGLFSIVVVKPLYVSSGSTIPIFYSVIVIMLLAYIPLMILYKKYND